MRKHKRTFQVTKGEQGEDETEVICWKDYGWLFSKADGGEQPTKSFQVATRQWNRKMEISVPAETEAVIRPRCPEEQWTSEDGWISSVSWRKVTADLEFQIQKQYPADCSTHGYIIRTQSLSFLQMMQKSQHRLAPVTSLLHVSIVYMYFNSVCFQHDKSLLLLF